MFNRPSIKLLLLFVLLLGLALFAVLEENGATSEVQAQSASSDDSVDSASPSAEIEVNIVTNAPQNVGDPVAFVAVMERSSLGMTFAWSFGDGSTTEVSNSPVVTHTYSTAGTFDVAVIVSDNNSSDRGSAFTQVTINPVPPITPTPVPITGLKLSSEGPTEAGSPVNFIATWETGTDVTLEWYFTANSAPVIAPAIVSHTYDEPGEYIVTVIAKNGNTFPDQYYQLELVITPACIAGLDIKPVQDASVNEPVQFEAQITKGTDVEYTWNFGDTSSGSNTFESEVPVAVHTYSQTGTYEVSVVADNVCNEQRTSRTVVVREAPITGLQIISNSPRDPDEDALTFVATVDSGIVLNHTWNLGDGTVLETGTRNTLSYTYEEEDTYLVSVTASNNRNSETASTVAMWVNWGSPGQVYIYEVDRSTSPPTITRVNPLYLKAQTEYRFSTIPLTSVDQPDVAEMEWSFGDGAIMTTDMAFHVYGRTGEYEVIATNVGESPQWYEASANVGRKVLFMPVAVQDGTPPANGNPGGVGPTPLPPTPVTPSVTVTITPTETATMETTTPAPPSETPPVNETPEPSDTPVTPTIPVPSVTPTTPVPPTPPTPAQTPVPSETPGGTIPPTPGGTIP